MKRLCIWAKPDDDCFKSFPPFFRRMTARRKWHHRLHMLPSNKTRGGGPDSPPFTHHDATKSVNCRNWQTREWRTLSVHFAAENKALPRKKFLMELVESPLFAFWSALCLDRAIPIYLFSHLRRRSKYRSYERKERSLQSRAWPQRSKSCPWL